MLNIRKHKKIYYVPGIFSLLVIPLVFWYYGTEYIKENDFRVIGFNMPPKDFSKNYPNENYKLGYEYDEIKVPVDFSEETEQNYFELIKKLQKENIDKTGIKFQFSSENTYDDFIKFLNLMEKTEQGRYLIDLVDDNFYVIHHKKFKSEITPFYCGLYYSDDRTALQKFIEETKLFSKKLPNYTFPIIIGYFVLVLCAIFRPKLVLKF